MFCFVFLLIRGFFVYTCIVFHNNLKGCAGTVYYFLYILVSTLPCFFFFIQIEFLVGVEYGICYKLNNSDASRDIRLLASFFFYFFLFYNSGRKIYYSHISLRTISFILSH